jgi:hypothetical protein
MIKEKQLSEIQTLLEDYEEVAKYLYLIDRDRQTGWNYWNPYNHHKEAAEFLLKYRREQMAKEMDNHLIAIFRDIEMRLKELGIEPDHRQIHYEKPKFPAGGGTNAVVGIIPTIIIESWEDPPPHFYSGKTV